MPVDVQPAIPEVIACTASAITFGRFLPEARGVSLGGGTKEVAGDPLASVPANSPHQRNPQDGFNASMGNSRARSSFAQLKQMPSAAIPIQAVASSPLSRRRLSS